MRTDTDALKGYSASLRGLQSWGYRSSAAYGTHLEVQNSLNRLALWFETAATQAEQTETALASVTSVWKPGTMQVSHTEVWNLGQQLKKKPVTTTFSGTVSTSLAAARFTHSGAHHRFDTDVRVFDTQASGSAGLKLWDKKKKFSPEARIQAEASMSAASVTGNYRVFSGTGMSGSLRSGVSPGLFMRKPRQCCPKTNRHWKHLWELRRSGENVPWRSLFWAVR
ncbi:hypothetical protein [Faecalibaculum rodentium]|uniref:hypothetical protein n=1 Tax=Faecalibaculum rodentium TaxID=1702221 RepID=UPI002714EA34|nr:hypothetical protein [Faecalibaculum rodentium]